MGVPECRNDSELVRCPVERIRRAVSFIWLGVVQNAYGVALIAETPLEFVQYRHTGCQRSRARAKEEQPSDDGKTDPWEHPQPVTHQPRGRSAVGATPPATRC